MGGVPRKFTIEVWSNTNEPSLSLWMWEEVHSEASPVVTKWGISPHPQNLHSKRMGRDRRLGSDPSAISYKPHVNIRTVQGGSPGAGAHMGQGNERRGYTGD